MLAKLTSKNQLTLPKSVTDRLGPVQYFEVQLQAGQVLLTPVRIQRGDAVRAKLAELELGDEVIQRALDAARKPAKKAAAAPKKSSPIKTPPAKAGVAAVDNSVGKRVGKAVDKQVDKSATKSAAAGPAGKKAVATRGVSSAVKTASKSTRKAPAKSIRQKNAPAA
ncbi:hypothetical protein [Roseateles sp.]|uniref:hypothetical protein n=1 Tax=Roseateles sp. TaxID=1971397 RepID=UPI0031DE5C6E